MELTKLQEKGLIIIGRTYNGTLGGVKFVVTLFSHEYPMASYENSIPRGMGVINKLIDLGLVEVNNATDWATYKLTVRGEYEYQRLQLSQ